MNDDAGREHRRGGRFPRAAMALVLAGGALVLAMAGFYNFYYPRRIGAAQPIAFSHRVHAGDKRIGCVLCHPGVLEGRRAGVPSMDTCLLCHDRIITGHPEIRRLRERYDRGEPVEWREVYQLQEYVYFDHQAHVRRQVDCGACHGNVLEMDRVSEANRFTMGFCVQCHRDSSVSHDCLVCHR